MIFFSCRIPWNLKVILLLKVVTISWLKQLDDLSIVVVFVQLDKGLELNYICAVSQRQSSSSKESKTEIKTKIRKEFVDQE